MRLVASTVDIELVEVTHKGVVGAGLGRILRIQVHPLLLYGLELCQVIEVDASFSRVAPKEENTILEGQTVGSGTWRRLVRTSRVQWTDFSPIVREWVERVELVGALLQVSPTEKVNHVIVDACSVPG